MIVPRTRSGSRLGTNPERNQCTISVSVSEAQFE
jgi:hypothetical protein